MDKDIFLDTEEERLILENFENESRYMLASSKKLREELNLPIISKTFDYHCKK